LPGSPGRLVCIGDLGPPVLEPQVRCAAVVRAEDVVMVCQVWWEIGWLSLTEDCIVPMCWAGLNRAAKLHWALSTGWSEQGEVDCLVSCCGWWPGQ